MRNNWNDGSGLEILFRIVFALAGVGVIALVGGFVWGVWAWIS